MLELAQLIGLMPFIPSPMFRYIENANSNLWINKTIPGIVGVYAVLGDAEPGIYLNQTFLNSSANLTIFYGFSIQKPDLEFQSDCKTERFLQGVEWRLGSNFQGVMESGSVNLDLNFNDFESYVFSNKTIEPFYVDEGNSAVLSFYAEAVFKVEHWRLEPHLSCSKNTCTVYYSCDFYDSTFQNFQNNSAYSESFSKMDENPAVEGRFDYYDGVKELIISVKADNPNIAVYSGSNNFEYYSEEYPVFLDENNFSHATEIAEDVYFENGLVIANKSVGGSYFNFTLINASDSATVELKFPFDSENFSLNDSELNSSVSLSIPEFNSPGSIVNGSVVLKGGGKQLNGSVLVEIQGVGELNASVENGVGFFQFQMPNQSVAVEAFFEERGYFSSSDSRYVIVNTDYSSEILLMLSTFLVLAYGFSMISGYKSRLLASASVFFIFLMILFFVASNSGWVS